jgi:hypothetical protein
MTVPPVKASPQQEVPKPAPIPSASEASKDTSPPPQNVITTAPNPAVVMRKGKRLRAAFGWIVILFILFILWYPLRNGGSICEAAKNEIVQQVPYAVEILAARHPVKVGILRSALNEEGMIDKVAQEYVRTSMISQQNPNKFVCYLTYYIVVFIKDNVRNAQADWLEKQLNLK